jgi:hypothetical protein
MMMNHSTADEAMEAKRSIRNYLKDREEVSGIGIALDPDTSGYAVKVNLSKELPDNIDLQSLSPSVKVIVQVIGQIGYLMKTNFPR